MRLHRILPVACFFLCATAFAQHALTIFPLNPGIGFRSNSDKRHFFDLRGSYTYSALPFITFQMSENHRIVNDSVVKVSWGIALTLDSYVPGVGVPIGVEVFPLRANKRFSVLAEAEPKITFGPTNFLNSNIEGSFGIAYYFRRHKSDTAAGH